MSAGTAFVNTRGQWRARTAPAGGTRYRSRRVCGIFLAVSLLALSGHAQEAIAVPSGQAVNLTEVLVDETTGETLVRFRFVAPEIARAGGSVDYDTAGADMEHLCRNLVLPYLSEYEISTDRVVISMSDRDVPFGQANPQATQFFDAYRLEDADCIWEAF